MPEVRFLRRLEQAALSWNNNRTKRGRLRGTWSQRGPTYLCRTPGFFSQALAWLSTQETGWLCLPGGEFTSKKKNLFYSI